MAQISEMNDGNRNIEIFKKFTHLTAAKGAGIFQEEETEEKFRERMLLAAQKKLRNPEVNKFYQIRVGRNDPCPCGSEKKFKKCCLNKANQGDMPIEE